MTPAPDPRWDDLPPPGFHTTPELPRTTWKPIDLREIVAADHVPLQPTVGQRTDGHGLLYRGRTHTMSGESEAKKSWIAQAIAAQELAGGESVAYLDFEDSAEAVTRRMLTLGATRQWLVERFAYIAPQEPITSGRSQLELNAALGDLKPTLIILDGVTEALALHGHSSLDNDDLAKFGRLITRPLAETGAAVLSLDHVVKDSEGRGRYALGGVHKLNGVSGGAFTVENVSRSGEGLAGRSRILIAKDRPGQLRPHALPGTGDRWWYADFTLDTGLPEPAELVPPVEHTEAFRPTALMAKVSAALLGAPEPLTTNDITARVRGKAIDVRSAIAALVDAGHVQISTGPRASRLHTLVRPYPDGDPE